MAVSKIGIDFTKFNQITPPQLNISNSSKQLLIDVPAKANEMTNGWLGYGMLSTMFITLFWTLSDKTQFGDYGYDNLRALSITFAVCSVFSIVLLNSNFINNLIVVSTCIFMTMITMLIIIFTEGR